jgi:hypothetical protein
VKNVGAIIDAGRQSMLPWKVSRCLVRWLFISSSTACLQHGGSSICTAVSQSMRREQFTMMHNKSFRIAHHGNYSHLIGWLQFFAGSQDSE